MDDHAHPDVGDRTARIRRIRLQTGRLSMLRDYYAGVWGVQTVAEAADSIEFQFGASVVQFVPAAAGARPYYHFAIDVPANQFDQAKRWLTARGELLRDPDTGVDEFHFETWDARSAYVHDPAGNIVELIARRTRNRIMPGPFGPHMLLNISEIGVVVDEQQRDSARLAAALRLPRYHDSAMFLGDDRGLLVVVARDYAWYPQRTRCAERFALTVELAGDAGSSSRWDDGITCIECESEP